MRYLFIILAILITFSCNQGMSNQTEERVTIVSPNFNDTAYFVVGDYQSAFNKKGPDICFWRMVHITPDKTTYDDWIFAPMLFHRLDTVSVEKDYLALLEKIKIKNPYHVTQ